MEDKVRSIDIDEDSMHGRWEGPAKVNPLPLLVHLPRGEVLVCFRMKGLAWLPKSSIARNLDGLGPV